MSQIARLVFIALMGGVLILPCADLAWGQAENAPAPAPEAPPKPVEPSPLALEPKTPEEMFDAVVLLVDLARPELARTYLEQFLATEPGDELLLQLRRKHGTPAFLRLANVPELQPLSTRLLERVTAAARKQAENPEYIDTLLTQLRTGTPTQRSAALLELRNAGARAVPRILRHLNTPADPAERDALVNLLIQMGRPVIPPLLGALESPNPDLRAAAITVLGWLGDQEIVPYLFYPAFDDHQPPGVTVTARRALARILFGNENAVHRVTEYGAAAELLKIAQEFNRGERKLTTEPDGSVIVWRWIPELGTVQACVMTEPAAAVFRGLQFAQQALALTPDHVEAQTLVLGLALAAEVQAAGWDKPLPTGPGTAYDTALLAGAETVTRVLRDALADGRADTAVAALRVLAQIASRDQLLLSPVQPSPILAALNYPDPRVQFAAANTVLQLDPERSFPDSTRIVQILARALSDGGIPRVVIADPETARGGVTAGAFSRLGYDPMMVHTGREAFEAGTASQGIELMVLHANLVQWDLSQTIANLRADARTAMIPIVIHGPERVAFKLAALARRTPRALFVMEPTNDEGFELQVRPFLRRLSTPPLSEEQRSRQQAVAAYWLAHIANGRRTRLYDLAPAESALFAVATDPDLAADAMVALGAIPTRTVQERLEELAVNATLDPAVREAAALQLAFHLQRFGLLLNDARLAELRAAWQTAEVPTLKTALAAVIGTLQPNARLVGERLRGIPVIVPQ